MINRIAELAVDPLLARLLGLVQISNRRGDAILVFENLEC
jgi:hypothetical protein